MQKDSLHYAACLNVLKNSPLLKRMSDDEIEEMLLMFQFRTFPKGETAMSPQQTTRYFYIISRGRAKVSVFNPDSGREHILFLLEPGDGFDLISLLDGEGHEVVATALDDIAVLIIPVEQAKAWIRQHPEFNREFLPYLGQQMQKLANQVTDLALYNTEARLARLILTYMIPDKLPYEIRLINDLSQETLASMIGSVRIVVTRHLQKWKQENVISSTRGQWSVHDLPELLKKAERLLKR